MHIEDCLAENQKQMSVMGESIVGENVTIELNEITQSGTGQECVSDETAECKGECSKQLPEVHQTESDTSTIVEDKENLKLCSDIIKELSDLHISDPQKTETEVRNVSQDKNIITVEHQNTNSEFDDDEHATSRNSRAGESTSSATQKTNKGKKSKSKKNKRKKSSQNLTPEERASFNKLMKNLISNEVRRSSKNKTLMSQQDGSRIHRTSQGESADSSCGLEETGGVDCRKARNILNGVGGMHDYSDSFQSLTDNGESLPCSAYSDYRSEDSCSDSGKGGSDIQCAGEAFSGNGDCVFMYTFEVPHDLCGALIGKHGRLINSIQDQSNTKILVREHYTYSTKLCTIEGTQTGIKKALHLIRKRFPIQYFPALTLEQIVLQMQQLPVPEEAMQLRLPEGVGCEVIVSSMLCPGWLFLQQPTHPTHSSLPTLVQLMTEWYNQMKAPGIEGPQEGNLCAVPGVNGWYRAKVMNVYSNNEECEVMFVDYGGYSRMSVSLLRQIYKDFFTLPFQAQECMLGNVKPINGEEWSAESVQIFEELAIGSILQAIIVGYTAEGSIPIVHLYKSTCNFSSIFINHELVSRGVAQWTE